MTTINHVAKGQPDWQKTLNAIIDAVGDDTVTHVASPITFVNGASAASNDIYYIDAANGYRLVVLSVTNLQVTNFKVGDQPWQFPDGFKPINGATVPINQTAAVMIYPGGNTYLFDGDKAWGTTTTIADAYAGYVYFAQTTENSGSTTTGTATGTTTTGSTTNNN